MRAEVLNRWSESEAARSRIATASVDALMTLAANEDGQADTFDLAVIHQGILEATHEDAMQDQAEIANLIAIVNSDGFSEHVQSEARRRVKIMLGL